MISKRSKKEALFFLFLFLILFLLYFRTFNFDFIWDSKIQISNSIFLNKDTSLLKTFEYGYWQGAGFNKGANDYYRPLTILSFVLNKKFFGGSPLSYRIVNLLIFYLSLIPLFFLIREYKKENYFAEIIVLLFALYPLHIDNIVWVVGRCDLLMILWGFLSLLYLEYYVKYGKSKYAILSVIFFILGLFSKEAFVFFLPFLIFYVFIRKRRFYILYSLFIIFFTIFFFFIKFKVNGVGGVKITFFQPFYKNFLILLGAIGYYFKSMIFPVDFIMFVSAQTVMNFTYYIWGILFMVFFLIILLLYLKSKREFEIPILFIIIFFPLYLIFVFSNLFPYSLSTRYMILPFLGVLWIFTLLIFELKEKVRVYVVLSLAIIFSFSIIINSSYYKNELLFWGKIVKKRPDVAFVNAEYSRALLLNSNYIEAEEYLKKTLKLKMKEYTAILSAILYANIELRRCDYKKALEWLEKIENFRVEIPSKRDIFTIRFKIAKYRGEFLKAEKIALKALNLFPNKNYFLDKLFKLYICFDMWEKAEKLNKKENFSKISIFEVRKSLENLKIKDRIKYYAKCGNFKRAIKIIEDSKINYSTKDLFAVAEIYFRGEEIKKGENIIKKINEENKNNYIILKAIGVFYLNKLVKKDKSLYYFKKSLKINPNQPTLEKLVKNLSINN